MENKCLSRILVLDEPLTRKSTLEVLTKRKEPYEISYSNDKVCWTSWSSEYPSIAGDFYIRIRIACEATILVDGCPVGYTISIEPTRFLLQDCSEVSFYDHLDCALLLQQQLSDNIICMLGIPVYYFRVEPRDNSSDFTFKEYTLHDVVSCKYLKIMVPDGEMPSSNHKMSQFDFDWETDWIVEVSKTHFARAFGDSKFPKQRDFVWIPMMGRMWEVNSAYDERNEGLLYRSSTWKLSLTKYKDSTNKEGFENEIDALINNYESIFGIEVEEQRRESGVHHAPVASNVDYDIVKQDALRARMNANIIQTNICHRGLIVARNMYRNIKDIEYIKGLCSDKGTISFIIKPMKGDDHVICQFGSIEFAWSSRHSGIVVGDVIMPIAGTSMVIYRWNISLGVYEVEILAHKHPDKPKYMIRPEQHFFETTETIQRPYIEIKEGPCRVFPTPHELTNIKVYKDWVEMSELFKYNTNTPSCLINDVVRPLNGGLGFSVK